jgi:hypothetical protein
MDDRALGGIEGELRQISERLSGLERGHRDLRVENAKDHEAVMQQIGAMGDRFQADLDKKADQSDLEDVRDQGREGVSQIRGWFFTLFGLIVGAGLVNVILAHGI